MDPPAECTNPQPPQPPQHPRFLGPIYRSTPTLGREGPPTEAVVRWSLEARKCGALTELQPAAWSALRALGSTHTLPPAPAGRALSRGPVRRPCSDRRSGFRGQERSVDASPRGWTLPLPCAPPQSLRHHLYFVSILPVHTGLAVSWADSNSFNAHSNPEGWVLCAGPLHRGGHGGPERVTGSRPHR